MNKIQLSETASLVRVGDEWRACHNDSPITSCLMHLPYVDSEDVNTIIRAARKEALDMMRSIWDDFCERSKVSEGAAVLYTMRRLNDAWEEEL